MRGETRQTPLDLVNPDRFQSTLPMRGETSRTALFLPLLLISIHSPHAGRDITGLAELFADQEISIHSPHAGRDEIKTLQPNGEPISIHSPHAGRDNSAFLLMCRSSYFNPLSPCGERQQN